MKLSSKDLKDIKGIFPSVSKIPTLALVMTGFGRLFSCICSCCFNGRKQRQALRIQQRFDDNLDIRKLVKAQFDLKLLVSLLLTKEQKVLFMRN